MSELIVEPLKYYASHGPITDPREHAELFEHLSREIPALCKIVQNILIHVHHAHCYGVKLSEERKQEMNLRHVAKIMTRVLELDDRPLVIARPPEKREWGPVVTLRRCCALSYDIKLGPLVLAAVSLHISLQGDMKITGFVSIGRKPSNAG